MQSTPSKLLTAMRYCRMSHPQLRISQLELLLAVKARPGMTQSELANECDLTFSAVSKAVDVLGATGRRDKVSTARMGWIEARRDETDDRSRRVYLTKRGEQFVSAFEALIHDG